MITEHELRILQAKFDRKPHQAHYRELERLRRQFVAKFPPSRIPLLSLDNYIQGKRDKDSFCYWVEWKTADLGHIHGSPSKKFGVYYSPKLGRYDFTSRFENENEASFPAAHSTNAEFISFELGAVADSPSQRDQKRNSGEIDFEKQNRRNKRVGDQGEDVVYWAERRWLEANGKGDLAQNVEAICRKDVGAGYDIKSFELDGTPKHIEVKATTSKPPADSGSVRFHLSAREYEQAQELPNYYLFIVFDIKSAKPKIWRIREPAKLKSGLLHLQPSAYHATFTAHRPRVE